MLARVGVGVLVGVEVGVGVQVAVGVHVGVGVKVGIDVAVGVGVDVLVGHGVGVAVDVAVGVGDVGMAIAASVGVTSVPPSMMLMPPLVDSTASAAILTTQSKRIRQIARITAVLDWRTARLSAASGGGAGIRSVSLGIGVASTHARPSKTIHLPVSPLRVQ